jgi:general secretion pathway protein L
MSASQNLLIRLGAAESTAGGATWLLCDADGKSLSAQESGTLAQAAALAPGRRVVVLIPAGEVLTLEAALPAKAGAKLLQAVPFALEEQLAEDVENLHFAIGVRNADGRTPVAVIARRTLDAHLAALAAANLVPQALHSESMLIAAVPGQIVALIDGDDVHLRVPGAPALTLPVAPLGEAIDLALQGAQGQGVLAPTSDVLGFNVVATPGDWERHAAEVEAVRGRFARVNAQLLPQGVLPWLAQQLPLAAPINLLQGQHAPRTAQGVDLSRWRVAAALGAVLVLLHVGARTTEIVRLGRARAGVEAALVDAARPILGQSASAGTARKAIEARLASVRAGSGAGGSFLPALAALAQARAQVPGAKLATLSFQGGAVDAKFSTEDPASLERIGAALRQGGWQADLAGSSSNGRSFEGRIKLRSAGGGQPGAGS